MTGIDCDETRTDPCMAAQYYRNTLATVSQATRKGHIFSKVAEQTKEPQVGIIGCFRPERNVFLGN